MLILLRNFKVKDRYTKLLHNYRDWHSIRLGQHSSHLINNGDGLVNAIVFIVGIVATILVP